MAVLSQGLETNLAQGHQAFPTSMKGKAKLSCSPKEKQFIRKCEGLISVLSQSKSGQTREGEAFKIELPQT